MKKILFILLIFLNYSNLFANSHSFIDTLKIWNVGRHSVKNGAMDPHDYWTTDSYMINGNVTIKNIDYKKLISYSDSIFQSERFHYYIREDSTKKIYFSNGDIEIVAFDFNLNVGDSMQIFASYHELKLNYNFWAKVDSISNFDLNGISTNVQYITIKNQDYPNSDSFNDVWIYEIGSLKHGLLYPVYGLTADWYISPHLLCVSSNNYNIYNNPDFDDCYINTKTGFQSILNSGLIKIINNDNGGVRIDILNNNFGEITLYSIQGEKVYSENITYTSHQLCLPISGVFLYRFTSVKGKIQTGKVMLK